MSSIDVFMMGQINRGREEKVFNWLKAAEIIKQRGAAEASAGLAQDWNWTGGTIFKDGAPLPKEDTYCYLASTWATPVLEIDGAEIECWLMKSETPGWNSDTFWPPEALEVLGLKSGGAA